MWSWSKIMTINARPPTFSLLSGFLWSSSEHEHVQGSSETVEVKEEKKETDLTEITQQQEQHNWIWW